MSHGSQSFYYGDILRRYITLFLKTPHRCRKKKLLFSYSASGSDTRNCKIIFRFKWSSDLFHSIHVSNYWSTLGSAFEQKYLVCKTEIISVRFNSSQRVPTVSSLRHTSMKFQLYFGGKKIRKGFHISEEAQTYKLLLSVQTLGLLQFTMGSSDLKPQSINKLFLKFSIYKEKHLIFM